MSISLDASVRSILLGLKKITADTNTTQNRLATGKKVSSALDNASAFFTSNSLYNRANDLVSIKDNITTAINTVSVATTALGNIEKVLTQMKGLAEQAKAATTVADRTSYSTQYDALRTQLDNLAKDASYNGVNLIKGTPDSLSVTFNEDSSATLSITGVASDSAGLSVTAANDWGNATLATGTTNITADIALVDAALKMVRTTTASLGSNASLLNIRSDFTTTLIDTLKAGGDGLVNADLNEESANLLSLQTQQQLAVSALSMANNASQSILRLF